jgi:predicted PurR-regulated permease PerM
MEDFVSAPWLRRLIVAVLLGGIVLLGFRVLEPFIVPLVWAGILGYVSWPAYQRLLRACGGRALLAALLMTGAVGVAVVAPLAWVVAVLRVELIHAWHETQATLANGLQLPPALTRLPWIGERLRDLAARAAQDPHVLGTEVGKVTNQSFDQIAHVVGYIAHNVVKLLLAVLSLFFVYRDGERFSDQLAHAFEQVLGPRVHNYLHAITQTVKAVLYGLVLAAVGQGVLVGLGYWVAGTDAPLFLAALTTVCGLIPFAAPAVAAGVVLWVFLSGTTVAAVGLAIWCTIVMGYTDHIARPFLISQQARIPFLVVLFGVLGGLAAFGLVGLFVGPVILAVLLALWREWLIESESRRPAPGAP